MADLNFESFSNGRYAVLKKLGEGGKGIVYRCRDTALDRMVALKLIKTSLDEETSARFHREAQTTAKLNHPSIVSIHDIGTQDGHPFLVIEYVEGKSLDDLIQENGPMPPSEILRISKDIASGLEYAHREGVLHRDIKPENIMITIEGKPKIMDFGLARSVESSHITPGGTIVGTPAYLSPESALGKENDERSDLYSLGCVMYSMAAGHPPFVSEDNLKVIFSHINDIPRPISQMRKDFPVDLESLIMRLMAKDPSRRPANASEVLKIMSALHYGSEQAVPAEKENAANEFSKFSGGSSSGRHVRPLIGREEQVQTLRAQIDSALTGSGSVVLIVGNRGTGKSRLVEEASSYASMRGMRILSVRCSETKTSVPGQALTDLFREYFSDKPTQLVYKISGDYADELAKLLPELAPKLGRIPDTSSLSPEQQSTRFLEAIGTFLNNISVEDPVLITLDDIQYIDRISLNFIRYYSEFIPDSRICLLGTATPFDEDSELLKTVSEAVRSHSLEMMEIDNLTMDQASLMISNFLGEDSGSITDDFRNLIYSKTTGNPLFLEETLKYLIDRKQIYRREDGSWNRESLTELRLPSSVRNIIKEKLDSLDDKSLNILKIASVIGNEFDYEVLREMSGEKDEDKFLDILEDLIRNRFLSEKKGGPGQVHLIFSDPQTRDILYEGISMIRRGRYHQRAAEIMEKNSGNRPLDRFTVSNLARHYMEGRNIPKALEYYGKQGDMWVESSDFREAVKTFGICLDLVRELNDGSSVEDKLNLEGEFLVKIAKCTSTFNLPQAMKNVRMALDIFRKTGNEAGIIESSTGLVNQAEDPDYYYGIVKALPDRDETIGLKLAFYDTYASNISLYQGRNEEAMAIIKECIKTAESRNMDRVLLRLNWKINSITPIRSESDKKNIYGRFREVYEKTANGSDVMTIEEAVSGLAPELIADWLANFHFMVGCDLKSTENEFRKSEEWSLKHRNTSYLDVVQAERNYMVTLQRSGAEAAAKYAREKLLSFTGKDLLGGVKHTYTYLKAVLAWYDAVNGNEAAAMSEIAEVREMRGEQYRILYHLPLIQMLMDTGRLDEAAGEIESAMEVLKSRPLVMENTGYTVFMNVLNGDLGFLQNNRERMDCSVEALKKLEETLNEDWVTACRLRVESHILSTEKDYGKASGKLNQAAEIWHGHEMYFWEAKDLLSLASAQQEAGKREDANESINRSIEGFTRMGASFYAELALKKKELLKA